MSPFVSGILLGFGLIMSLGPQNVFIIRQGIQRRHVAVAVGVTVLCDLVLSTIGVFTVGTVTSSSEWLSQALSASTALLLIGYGCLALRDACLVSDAKFLDSSQAAKSASMVGSAALAFALLNPYVYLDTIFIFGGFGSKLDLEGRVQFLVGVILASAVWFTSIATLSVKFSHILARPTAQRWMNGVVAMAMFSFSIPFLRELL